MTNSSLAVCIYWICYDIHSHYSETFILYTVIKKADKKRSHLAVFILKCLQWLSLSHFKAGRQDFHAYTHGSGSNLGTFRSPLWMAGTKPLEQCQLPRHMLTGQELKSRIELGSIPDIQKWYVGIQVSNLKGFLAAWPKTLVCLFSHKILSSRKQNVALIRHL